VSTEPLSPTQYPPTVEIFEVETKARTRLHRAPRLYLPSWALRRRRPSLGLSLAHERANLRLLGREVAHALGLPVYRVQAVERDRAARHDDTHIRMAALYASLRLALAPADKSP